LVVLNWHAKSTRKDFVMHEGHGGGWGDAQSGETSGMFPYPAFELFHKTMRSSPACSAISSNRDWPNG
jgi:hypothetical protein